jgi:hypothetical protein
MEIATAGARDKPPLHMVSAQRVAPLHRIEAAAIALAEMLNPSQIGC